VLEALITILTVWQINIYIDLEPVQVVDNVVRTVAENIQRVWSEPSELAESVSDWLVEQGLLVDRPPPPTPNPWQGPFQIEDVLSHPEEYIIRYPPYAERVSDLVTERITHDEF